MLTNPTPLMSEPWNLSPINDMQAVTPNDNTDLPGGKTKALIFTTAGNVVMVTAAGTTITLPISSAWFGIAYISAARIKATGTTSTGIFACY
jgi:hypothetical protein